MAVVVYTAKHSIAPDHTVDTEYNLLISARELSPTTGIDKEESKSISGYVETVVKHRWREWNVQTIPMSLSGAVYVTEFLDSVLGGETFEIDLASNNPGGTLTTISAQLDGSSVKRNMVSGNALVSYSFNIREYVTR